MKTKSIYNTLSRSHLVGKTITLFIMICSVVACAGKRNAGTAEDIQNFEDLKELVSSREFEIQNQWANPMRAGNINLIGNPNFIRFKGDNVNVHLPYFGVRQSGGGYGSGEGGIKYEGPLRNLEIEEQERRMLLRFEGNAKGTENLEFLIYLYPNGKTNTSVNSSQRDAISYQGEVRKLPKEQQGD